MRFLKNYRAMAIAAPLLKLVEVLFELAVPIVVADIIDVGINGDGGWTYVLYCCLFILLFGILGFCCALLGQYFSARVACGFEKDLDDALFSKIQSLSYADLDKFGSSELLTRMTNDVKKMRSGVNMTLRLLLRSPIIVIGSVIMAFTVSVKAGVIFAISVTVLAVVVFAIMAITIPMYRKAQDDTDQVTEATRDNASGQKVVRALCLQQDEKERFEKRSDRLTASQKAAGAVNILISPVTYVIVNIAIIVLLYFGALDFNSGSLTQGEVVELYNYMAQILAELIKFANFVMTLTKAFASADRINEVLDFEPTLRHTESDKKEGLPFLVFDNVTMRYPEGGRNALENVSFTCDAGETVGIVGTTGSGKSTLVNLIPHFLDVSEGEVRIDGVRADGYGDRDLRAICAVVPQSDSLFAGSLRENMCYGAEASDEEIYEALRMAEADGFVSEKSGGLDEIVERGGANFSGGQRRRLCIARALLKKPQILILDDSFSSLDYLTDAKIRASLKGYAPVTVIASQRTSSVMAADKIVVLDEGKVAGMGTHDELMESCSRYRDIYLLQKGESA